MADYCKINSSGVAAFMGANNPGWISNLGLSVATTTDANDTIVIQGATAALSSTNPIHVTIASSATPGLLKPLTATANVSVLLTAAHFGCADGGNTIDIRFRLYAINDTEALKWGISRVAGLTAIASTSSTATQASVTNSQIMLVNSSLNSGTWPCIEVGWFLADFNDTGDIWTISTSANELVSGLTLLDSSREEPLNYLINGSMDFWQRGTSFAAIANGTYTADRWRYLKTGDMVHTVSRDTDIPTLGQSGYQSSYSLKVDCTTVDAAIAVGDNCHIIQAIEGSLYQQIIGRYCRMTFWVKAVKAGIYCVAFRNNGSDRSYVAEYTINSASTWEFKEIKLLVNPSGGTEDYKSNAGLYVSFTIACGSTFQTTAGAWQTGNYISTSNQVNGCDNTNNNFWVTQVMFHTGDAQIPFIRSGKSHAAELALCQRYYEKSYDLGTSPATVTAYGACIGIGEGGNAFSGLASFKVEKRATPTMVIYSTATGTSGKIRDSSSAADVAGSFVSDYIGTHSAAGQSTLAATESDMYQFHWTASAEI